MINQTLLCKWWSHILDDIYLRFKRTGAFYTGIESFDAGHIKCSCRPHL